MLLLLVLQVPFATLLWLLLLLKLLVPFAALLLLVVLLWVRLVQGGVAEGGHALRGGQLRVDAVCGIGGRLALLRAHERPGRKLHCRVYVCLGSVGCRDLQHALPYDR